MRFILSSKTPENFGNTKISMNLHLHDYKLSVKNQAKLSKKPHKIKLFENYESGIGNEDLKLIQRLEF